MEKTPYSENFRCLFEKNIFRFHSTNPVEVIHNCIFLITNKNESFSCLKICCQIFVFSNVLNMKRPIKKPY